MTSRRTTSTARLPARAAMRAAAGPRAPNRQNPPSAPRAKWTSWHLLCIKRRTRGRAQRLSRSGRAGLSLGQPEPWRRGGRPAARWRRRRR
eukprot:7370077-Lingulodinium_polyedra.AAC.1